MALSSAQRLVAGLASTITSVLRQQHLANDTFIFVRNVLLDVRVAVTRQWNQDFPDHLSCLPVELHTRCFELLGLRDRLVVTHVCSHWRTVALGCPWLWNDIDLKAFKNDINFTSEETDDDFYEYISDSKDRGCVELLTECLARSHPLPVYLVCKDPLSEALCIVISRNIHRFVRLVGPFRAPWSPHFISSSAHQLAHFECTSLQFPDGFSGRDLPRLRRTDASCLYIPPTFHPMSHVRYLSCLHIFRKGRLDLDHIFDFFPRLETLVLDCELDYTALPQTLPPSLRELRLECRYTNGRSEKLASSLELWQGHSLRMLSVPRVTDVEPILAFFLLGIGNNTSFAMEVTWDFTLKLIPNRVDMCSVDFTLLDDMVLQLRPVTERVTHLTLPCHSNWKIKSLSHLAYPEITELTLRDQSDEPTTCEEFPSFVILEGRAPGMTTIHAPKLLRLVVSFNQLPSIDVTSKGSLVSGWNLRRFIDFTATRLESITIETPESAAFDEWDWSSLFKFTDQVICKGSSRIKILHPDCGGERASG